MTIPLQEYYSLLNTIQFLTELTDPQKTPKVPKEVRLKAMQCLKHYPRPDRIEEFFTESDISYSRLPIRF